MHKEFGIHWKKLRLLGDTKSQGDLGFRDFEVFNKALLTKQIWRFIKTLNFLSVQILKSKYFPTYGVLDANINSNPSLIWRSFYDSIDLVKEGMVWRISNGQLDLG